MDINFNGTIIALFGSLPLETLDSQGGTGFAPSSLDFFFFLKQRECSFGCGAERREEEKEVMGRWGQGEASVSPSLN